MLYTSFTTDGEFDRVTKKTILEHMNKTKVRTGKEDINKLEKLVDLIGTRYINLKHFYSFMNHELIFKRFLLGDEQ